MPPFGPCPRASRHAWLRGSLAGFFLLLDGAGPAAWPAAAPELTSGFVREASAQALVSAAPDDADVVSIRAQPVCIAASAWSFGKLGDTVLFVHRRQGQELRVGYFAYFDVERPWGKNALTYGVLPAALIDATYSHFAFVLPGVQRLLYGPGDVEGASVLYRADECGKLAVLSGVADDGTHGRVSLSRADLTSSDGRVILLTNVWSHQLGAPGGADYAREQGANVRCFSGNALKPLTREIAASYRLGDFERPLRARPAFYRDGVDRAIHR